MKPFFKYFGSKARASGHLPPPLLDHIIEPFAGSASYSVRYNAPRVTLIEKSPIIAGVWRYLIRVSESEILALPDVYQGDLVASLPVCEEARNLIGLSIGPGNRAPQNRVSPWFGRMPAHRKKRGADDSVWGPGLRARITRQLPEIRHWEIVEGEYMRAQDVRAIWIVDPPYQHVRAQYSVRNTIDYAHLSSWVRSRQGVALVHEQAGANWLPFESWQHTGATVRARGAAKQTSHEALAAFVDGEQVSIK